MRNGDKDQMNRAKTVTVLLLALSCLLAGCGREAVPAGGQAAEQASAEGLSYRQIDQETAKRMMRSDDGHVVVDVRRGDEYAQGHIPGAILIPNEEIGTEPPEELPDMDQVILIYCRSGNRSKQAAEKLAGMGYTNVYEFGGILDWTGETVSGD